MDRYLIRIEGHADGRPLAGAPSDWPVYLEHAEFADVLGRGVVSFTHLAHKAMVFPTLGAAMAFCLTIHPKRPRRPDGRPNRPLTAFTVSLKRAEDEG